MSRAEIIRNFRQKRKQELVNVMGGKCQICGYNKCIAALEFHHCIPDQKKFGLSNGDCRSLEKDLEEAKKCILLCSNCHREVEYYNILTTPSFDEQKANELLDIYKAQKEEIKKNTTCPICGKTMTNGAKMCSECSHKNRRVTDRPNKEELKQLIRTLPFTTIAKKYGVTDNSIRKWCLSYGLPSKKKDINKFSDEDWDKI